MARSSPGDASLKAIFEAERRADRTIREAEGLARSLRNEADAAAARIVEEKRLELARRRPERLAREVAEAEREAAARLDEAREKASRLRRLAAPRIEALVDRLVRMVLPR